jgi:hypothetical protein
VDHAVEGLAKRMLFGAPQPAQQGRPRIILGIDCTTSMGEYIAERRITPETASRLSEGLFKDHPELEVQLCYFRGDDQSSKQPRQFVSTEWYTRPEELAQAITAIKYWPGWTQHCPLLRHAVAEAEKQMVQQVIILSDAFEEKTPRRPHGDDLKAACVHAQHLRDLGTKIVVGYKGSIRGGCPLDRAGISAEQAFRDIAEANGGYCFLLKPTDLTERFSEIGAQATLSAKGDSLGAQALLEHLRAVPFEMNLVGRLRSASRKVVSLVSNSRCPSAHNRKTRMGSGVDPFFTNIPRRTHLTSLGRQAMPMFEQVKLLSIPLRA